MMMMTGTLIRTGSVFHLCGFQQRHRLTLKRMDNLRQGKARIVNSTSDNTKNQFYRGLVSQSPKLVALAGTRSKHANR